MKVDLTNLGTVNKNSVVLTNDKGRSVEIVFSYQTPVVVIGMGRQLVHENDWSTTTGKLLNEYEPDKKARVDDKTFNDYLGFVLNDLIVNN